jgi:hypothetical protein
MHRSPADKLKSSTLFIVAREDTSADGPRLPRIREQFEKAPGPKQLINSGWLCARSVSLPNESRRPRDAPDPPLSLRQMNYSARTGCGATRMKLAAYHGLVSGAPRL